MATIKEYFDTDFNKTLSSMKDFTISSPSEEKAIIIARIHLDFDSNTKYLSFYLPVLLNSYGLIEDILKNLSPFLDITKNAEIQTRLPGEEFMTDTDLRFSGRIFFYSESVIDSEGFKKLQLESKSKGLYIHYRGPEFSLERSRLEKPLAFISHDSRDKDLIAKPITIGLSKLMCPVWFDEYSLRVGNGLRETIEQGIKQCKKCVLILSPNFLSNKGWTKTEFDSIFTRQLIEEKKIILPVWYKVSKKDVYEYSPSLADYLGLNWEDLGEEEVIRQLYREITA